MLPVAVQQNCKILCLERQFWRVELVCKLGQEALPSARFCQLSLMLCNPADPAMDYTNKGDLLTLGKLFAKLRKYSRQYRIAIDLTLMQILGQQGLIGIIPD